MQTPLIASSRLRNLPQNFPLGVGTGRLKVARCDSSTAAGHGHSRYVSFTQMVLGSGLEARPMRRYSSRMSGWARTCHCPGQSAHWPLQLPLRAVRPVPPAVSRGIRPCELALPDDDDW